MKRGDIMAKSWIITGAANNKSREELKGNSKKSKALAQREQALKDKGSVTINIDKIFINDSQDYMNYKRLKEDMERR